MLMSLCPSQAIFTATAQTAQCGGGTRAAAGSILDQPWKRRRALVADTGQELHALGCCPFLAEQQTKMRQHEPLGHCLWLWPERLALQSPCGTRPWTLRSSRLSPDLKPTALLQ